MKTLKFITKPIWSPTINISKIMKRTIPNTPKIFMRMLKDEDGTDIWTSFLIFSVVVFMTSIIMTSVTMTLKAPLTIAFCIIFTVYLALYYTRDYLKT